jgi:hypothetical protein
MPKKMDLKHHLKKTTQAQRDIIEWIHEQENCLYAVAKDRYFEHEEEYVRRFCEFKAIAPIVNIPTEIEQEPVVKKKRLNMTVEETKIGLTVVLTKDEIEKLGLSLKLTTKEAVRQIKQKLGLE